jgi:AraC-like DNA-binding protein
MAYNSFALFHDIHSLLLIQPRISQQEICRKLGIERHTIERVTLKFAQKSFRDYRNSCMLEKAITMLSNSRLTIKEIALDIGYQSSRAFSRAFANSVGLSPSAYRKHLVNSVNSDD